MLGSRDFVDPRLDRFLLEKYSFSSFGSRDFVDPRLDSSLASFRSPFLSSKPLFKPPFVLYYVLNPSLKRPSAHPRIERLRRSSSRMILLELGSRDFVDPRLEKIFVS